MTNEAFDGVPYSPEETSPALDTPAETLNWGGGDITRTPCISGAQPVTFDTQVPDGRGNAAFGMEEILGR